MIENSFQRNNLSFKDKVAGLDYSLIFLVLLLGIISVFAMYSTERGNFDYYTKSHLYRFCTFFFLFILISFLKIQFWFSFAYIFYGLILIFKLFIN